MSEPSLALQAAVRARFASFTAVTSLVPANAIFDRHGRPERFPCIILGEGQAFYSRLYETYFEKVYLDAHIWFAEEGMAGLKATAGAIRSALSDGPLITDGFRVSDLGITGARFLRDPDGVHSHAVITIEALMVEAD